MIIAQISDTHIELDKPGSSERIGDLECTIADINSLDPAPDLIVHTGDVVHNGRGEEYKEAARVLAAARRPVYCIVGNKDDRENFRAAFISSGYLEPDPAFVEYAVEEFPVRLLMVDTLSPVSNKGDFCAERARRLVERIDADPVRPIAVLAHHPPFMVPVGPDPLNFDSGEAMARFSRSLQHSGRVIAVFSGHVHRGTAGYVGTIPATVAPSVATNLRKGEYPRHMDRRPVYHIHRFEAGLGFSTQSRIVWAGGAPAVETQVIDREMPAQN
jgi:3',5'-cyclic-AMP phosphodiesterase